MSKAKAPQNLQVAKSTLDATDAQILGALDSDARLSMSELARLVGMSAPSVSERVRRLEAGGVIRGFTVDVDTRAIGYQIRAMVRIRPLPGKLHLVERLIQERPGFVECDKITGDETFLARLVVRTIEQWTTSSKRSRNTPSPAPPLSRNVCQTTLAAPVAKNQADCLKRPG
jgi:Lrp/AsnC family leucine-responsive transcriptional regulator